MPQYIQVTFTGFFPAEDEDLIADFYGCPEGQNKREFCCEKAKDVLADFLKAPTALNINRQKDAEKATLQNELAERVKSALSYEIEVVEA